MSLWTSARIPSTKSLTAGDNTGPSIGLTRAAFDSSSATWPASIRTNGTERSSTGGKPSPTTRELRRLTRTAWRRPLASFGLGLAGSAVSLAHGNPIAAGLSAAAAVVGLRRQADPSSAYAYLFRAQAHPGALKDGLATPAETSSAHRASTLSPGARMK